MEISLFSPKISLEQYHVLFSKRLNGSSDGGESAKHSFTLPNPDTFPFMETENPSDPKITKTGVNQFHGLPPCLLASKTYKNYFTCVPRTLEKQ